MTAPFLFFLQQGVAPPAVEAAAQTAGSSVEPSAQLFRFLFSRVPQSVQIAGILIGGAFVIVGGWHAWKYRRRIRDWLQARSRFYKIGIAASVAVVGLVVGGTSLYSYNYMMHNNDFCSSCHIMDNAWNRFQVSAHKDLGCHSCHRQSMLASTKELFWWVLERRMAVPAHDKVPTAICSECHVQTAVDTARSNVLLTAGHRLHLQSDSSALKNVECVSCHGNDFHLFRPNNATCSQSGCHTDIRVKLGAMSGARFLHCTTCHDFRKRGESGAVQADAKRVIAPQAITCGACHEMSEKILRWDVAADPHNGSCGSCHNPHKQTEPRDAFKSCATAQCHASADTLTALHRGLGTHTLDQCGACHQAHSWKVKGGDCLSCHKTIYNDRPGVRPARPPESVEESPPRHRQVVPEPLLREISLRSAPRTVGRRRSAPRAHQGRAPTSTDTTFLHSRHRAVACAECHVSTGSHGAIKVTAPRDCLACHHGTKQKATCTTCHETGSVGPRARPVTFTISARPNPVTRDLAFAHSRHATLDCAQCHAANDRRTPTAATCTGCHTVHHEPSRDCASCHATAKAGHTRTAHDGCASCHAPERFAAPRLTRPLCLACHQEQKEHYPARDCAGCHAVPDHPNAPGAPMR